MSCIPPNYFRQLTLLLYVSICFNTASESLGGIYLSAGWQQRGIPVPRSAQENLRQIELRSYPMLCRI